MFLLDTDVVSQRLKARPNPAVMAWLQGVHSLDLRVSAVTIEEIRYGAERMPPGRRRREIAQWLENDLLIGFADRILPIDAAIADRCGQMIAAAKHKQHNPELEDALIASTALIHGLKVATLNRKHFEKLSVELVQF